MTSAIVMFVIAAFFSGAVTAVFVMLVAGIHAGDRPRHLTAAPHGRLEALTRTMLGVGVRTSHGDAQRTNRCARQTCSQPAPLHPDSAARHSRTIRLSRPKEWSRHDSNHAPDIPHLDWP